jgi:hypothetical protein
VPALHRFPRLLRHAVRPLVLAGSLKADQTINDNINVTGNTDFDGTTLSFWTFLDEWISGTPSNAFVVYKNGNMWAADAGGVMITARWAWVPWCWARNPA